MVRLLSTGCMLAMMLGAVAADDTKDSKDVVTWEREVNGLDLKLDVGKETVKIAAFSGDNGVIVSCKYTVKDGVFKAKITGVEEKGQFPAKPKEGTEFTFKWKVTGDTAVLSDFEGKDLEDAKGVLEGDYKKKKK